jgi:hypothetical protein
MKFISKSIMLTIVLVVVSACSTAFDSAGLSADEAGLLSVALSVNPITDTFDADYSLDLAISAEGNDIAITATGRVINDPANGNSLISMAGELAGIPDLGEETFPYDFEFRTLNATDLYARGVGNFIDSSMSIDQWIFLDLGVTTQLATAGAPELQTSGLFTNGQLDVTGLYDILGTNLFDSAANYMQVTRGDDVDGLAHFTVNLDLGDWVGSDELQTALQTLIPLLAGDAVPAEELDAGMSQLAILPVVGVLFSDGTYQFDYYVDPTTATLGRATITIDLTVDPAMMGQAGDPATVAFTFDMTYREFGVDSTVVAPEDFVDLMGGG